MPSLAFHEISLIEAGRFVAAQLERCPKLVIETCPRVTVFMESLLWQRVYVVGWRPTGDRLRKMARGIRQLTKPGAGAIL
jgi:hypothetical protein